MFYALYGADGPDQTSRFLITWCENYCWIAEYANSIGDDADFDIYMKEYPCHTVRELEDEINLEIRGICGGKANEPIELFRLRYIPFRNTDDYILVVSADYGILPEWDAEIVDSFVWSFENDLLIPLLVFAKFMENEIKEEMVTLITQIHFLVHEVTDLALEGRYGSALKRLDWPALYKYFLPVVFTTYREHTIDAFHLQKQKIGRIKQVGGKRIHGRCKRDDRPVHAAEIV